MAARTNFLRASWGKRGEGTIRQLLLGRKNSSYHLDEIGIGMLFPNINLMDRT